MMQKIKILFLSSLFLITACNSQPSTPAPQVDAKPKEVTFTLPEGWVEDSKFFPNQDEQTLVYHKNDVPKGTVQIILKSEIDNPTNTSLQGYFDDQYQECQKQNPENAENEQKNSDDNYGNDVLYIPCLRDDLSDTEKWSKKEINGITAYRSKVHGIPESGQETELVFVAMDKKIITIQAVYEGIPDESIAETQKILDSVKIE